MPGESRCARCNTSCEPEDLDECLGCKSPDLCPACMTGPTKHDCTTRAFQRGGAAKILRNLVDGGAIA